ncbi:nicotinamide mononucleotide transporter [Actinosynnema sp. NPDC023587]|uniref:nicotinamide mononucleotide transporter n=1 Tax=Actinosynnema sp. NPDC023587 TaxID=3154695 RepID=UPI0033DF3F48
MAVFVMGALCVWLAAWQSPENRPIGIFDNIAFLVLFVTGGPYADSGLQVVYPALAAYG